jgi:hypothetical protein
MRLGIGGALAGAIAWAWMQDAERTTTGLQYGIPAGAAAGLVLASGFFAGLLLIEMHREGD